MFKSTAFSNPEPKSRFRAEGVLVAPIPRYIVREEIEESLMNRLQISWSPEMFLVQDEKFAKEWLEQNGIQDFDEPEFMCFWTPATTEAKETIDEILSKYS